ncbi:hypothetical protein LTR37_008604 [Vermiconidia calcicola]|uniref:Uncharacterized protein n=1 Tax=Vermiconidia calcicola TaxID=1690605 RepID=A0ACC3NCT8_9PEZI|nr:hypothetical protein LTR37_008604 [Vermiconidia calcicola]
MSSSASTKKTDQDVGQQGAVEQTVVKSKEQSASASANVSLVSSFIRSYVDMTHKANGSSRRLVAFCGKSKKETAADGSSTEQNQQNATAGGAGVGKLNAHGAASAEQKGRQIRAAIQDENNA